MNKTFSCLKFNSILTTKFCHAFHSFLGVVAKLNVKLLLLFFIFEMKQSDFLSALFLEDMVFNGHFDWKLVNYMNWMGLV
jgi:hypothetical protein